MTQYRHEELIGRYLNRSASNEECAELDAALIADPAAAVRLRDFAWIEILLYDAFLEDAVPTHDCPLPWVARAASLHANGNFNDEASQNSTIIAAGSDNRQVTRKIRLGRWQVDYGQALAFSFLGSGMLYALYVIAIFVGIRKHGAIDVGRGEQAASTVATIRNMAGVEWSERATANTSSEALARSTQVAVGESLQINAGFVELQLDQGAALLIEGPAEWTIDGGNRATLKRGRLVARVPQQAVGFVLDTPTSQIVDLGTEFGVEVAEDGTTEVHMLAGAAVVASASSAVTAPRIKLVAGDAATVAEIGAGAPTIRRVPLDRQPYAPLVRRLPGGDIPAHNVVLVSGGKPVTSSDSYDAPDFSFSAGAVTDGRLRDVGVRSDWSFWVARDGLSKATLVVDLLGEFTIAEIRLQPTHNGVWKNRATRDFRISVSTDGQDFATVLEGTLPCAFDQEEVSLELFPLETPALGRYVRFESLSWYGLAAGINEIQVLASIR